MISTPPYVPAIIGTSKAGTALLKFLDGPFTGVSITIGKIGVEELPDGTAKLNYAYYIVEGQELVKDAPALDKYVGDYIVWLVSVKTSMQVPEEEND